MELLSKEILDILTYLLPGLFAAWIFYGLTAFPKPSQLERIIQALIFTILIRGLVTILQWMLIWIGKNWFILGVWTNNVNLILLSLSSIFFGLLFCRYANNDWIHTILRKMKLTNLTSYPSEWYGSFANNPTYIVLHFNDGRRLYGWPVEWPNQPDKGHFSIAEAEWLTEKGSIELINVKSILIPVSEIKFVEFMKLMENETFE